MTSDRAPKVRRQLPPLILHPFSDSSGPGKLLESSRASLMLQGLLPTGEMSVEDLDRTLLDGRYCEIRMLFYVGKDVMRWIEQCLETAERDETLDRAGIKYQSFAALLVEEPPPGVKAKLRKWGVADYKAIFTRALALNAMFTDAPPRLLLSDDFIRNYYRYADIIFASRQAQCVFTDLSSLGFEFEIYASGEYSRMLEQEWAEG